MKNISLHQFTPIRQWPGVLLSGLFLSGPGLAPLPAATPVAAGSDLTTKLNAATATNYTFDLLGNVYLGLYFTMNGGTRKTVIIDGAYGEDGSRAVIERREADWRFNVNTAGNTLAIRNAVITGTASSGGAGAIHVTAGNSTLDLHNTTFSGNTAGDVLGYGGALSAMSNTNTTVQGNVSFTGNRGAGQASGAVGIYGAAASTRSTLTFTGETIFEGNSTTYYGGAVTINYWADAVFEEKAIFRGNYTTLYYGGALDLYGGNSHAIFKKDAEFTGNYVRNTGTQAYGVRGGAVNVGWITGTDTPQLDFRGTTTFTDNYVWGYSTTKAYGGALSIVSGETNPDTAAPPADRDYTVLINKGIFENNLAYSDSGNAYGGAIYAKTQNNTLTLGSGSRFTNNYAKTLGGAIYFDQGTLNLNGNVVFEGNRQGASFDTGSGKPVYVAGSGTPNAIYFGVSSNTATLNLNTTAGEQIRFHDPIAAAAGKTVTVNKTGAGEVVFFQHDSALLTKTTVSGGTFRLADGALFGLKGTTANSTFTVGVGATLRGGAGSTLRTSLLAVNGTLRADAGAFHIDTNNAVTFGGASALAFTIVDADTFSQIVFDTPASLLLNGATLEISASGYVPSLDMSDTFTLVTGLSQQATGQFAQGESVMINGAEFAIVYNNGSIVLQQLTAVPEPAAYAALAGLGALTFILLRRRAA
ncbi:hypothetical protein OpiT1DRAFT_02837 [Opitutaceae bacterium TAV1]|nr:hypothetical protein OpiT1DRAFT_02837 [Opitutaceae bacterium TAV1]